MTYKETPIVYEPHELRALLFGTKTQTRQVIEIDGTPYDPASGPLPDCPFGRASDRIWVQERGIESKLAGYSSHAGLFRHDVPATPTNGYYWVERTRGTGASYSVLNCSREAALMSPTARTIAAKSMPRWACRILLEIVSVRAERLQDISDDDAIAEGIIPGVDRGNGRTFWRDYRLSGDGTFCVLTPQASFRSLWNSIHGEDHWETNPFVWRIEFARIPVERIVPPLDAEEIFLESVMGKHTQTEDFNNK